MANSRIVYVVWLYTTVLVGYQDKHGLQGKRLLVFLVITCHV